MDESLRQECQTGFGAIRASGVHLESVVEATTPASVKPNTLIMLAQDNIFTL